MSKFHVRTMLVGFDIFLSSFFLLFSNINVPLDRDRSEASVLGKETIIK